MKTTEEYNQFYKTELKQSLEQLEAKRLAIANRFSYKRYKRNLVILLVIDISIGISTNFEWFPQSLIGVIPGSVLYAIFAPLYIFFRRNWSFDPINKEYKEKVIPKIISFFGSQLTYKPTEGITLREFNQSSLFKMATACDSEDLVEGQIDGISIRLSDVNARRSADNNNHTLMMGLYGVIKLNKAVSSRVTISQSNIYNIDLTKYTKPTNQFMEQILGSTVVKAIHDTAHLQFIKTGHQDFDQNFQVTCAEESIALQLLNPTLCQIMVAVKKELGELGFFPFIKMAMFDDQLHIAFGGVDLFEGSANRSFVEKDSSKTYFHVMNYVVGIAKAAMM